MRTISTAEDKLLTATGGRRSLMRVKVKDSGGTFRDLTTYPGRNLVLGADWGETVDSNGMDANITLKRESEKLSIAPLMTKSALNLGFSFPGSYAPLIDLAREIQIDVAVVPDGVEPAAGDWVLAFHGYIDDVKPVAGKETVSLRCSGLEARLRDTWIERERAYAFAQGANATNGCQYWRPSEAVALGIRGVPTEVNKNGHFFRVTTAGTTGATEPTWPTAGTVADGSAVWTESGNTSDSAGALAETVMQQILDDNAANLGVSITLVTPVSPAWAILPYRVERQSVLQALRTLVDQIGWDLRFKWDGASSSFKLYFFTPDRAKVAPDRTFKPSEHYKLSQLQTQVAFIRNVVQVVYSDSNDRDAQGVPKRKIIQVSDATSISAYRRRFCEIAEDKTANIDTSTEGNLLANNVLSDLAQPKAEQECSIPFFRFAELADLIRWKADGLHYDNDQDFAVVSYRHNFTGGAQPSQRTTLSCRGKPSTGFRRWLNLAGTDAHAFDLDNSGHVTITASDVVGGTRFQFTQTDKKNSLPPEFELHVSDTPGFTPSTSTLKGRGQYSELVLSDLLPGKQHYARVYPNSKNAKKIVKGQASAEISFVTGRASAGHIHQGIAIGDYPLNGGFETRLDLAGMPDHWTIVSGTFGTNIQAMEDGNGLSGKRYLRLLNGSVRSAIFPMLQEANESSRRGSLYRFYWWRKVGSSASAYSALIRLLDYQDNEVVILTVSSSMPADKSGHWVLEELFVRLKEGDSSARGLQLQVSGGGTGANQQIDIDEIRCQFLGSPWIEVGDTTYFTQNYEAVPAFATSPTTWQNYDATNEGKMALRKDQFGRVWVKGRVKSGTIGAGNPVATLPAGWRPPKPRRFSVPNIRASHVRGKRSAALSIAAAGTVLQCDQEDWDTLSEFDIGTNKGRFTATYTGYHLVSGRVLLASTAWLAGEYVNCYIRKNGTTVEIIGERNLADANITELKGTGVSGCVFLTAGDYIEVFVTHSHGANINTHNDANWNYFCVDRVDNQHAIVEIGTDGKICVVEGNNADVCFDGISFLTTEVASTVT